MTIKCPLCASATISRIDSISARMIEALYARKIALPISLRAATLECYECTDCALRFFYPPETGGEDFYESLQRYDWYYMEEKDEYLVALEFLSVGARILEVGAGKGAFSAYLDSGTYTGLELSQSAIDTARQQGVPLLKETIEEHCQRGEKYDAVVSFQVLEHVAHPDTFLRSCVDCLKPGGVMIISVPNEDGFLGKAVNNCLNMPPHHVTRWSERTLRQVSEIFGLQCIELRCDGLASYHTKWAYKSLVEASLRGLFGMKAPIVDLRRRARVVSAVSALIAPLVRRLSRARIKGHTVTAIYRKPDGPSKP